MECAVVKLVYKFDEKSTASVQKVSQLLKYDSKFFLVHKHIYNMDINTN